MAGLVRELGEELERGKASLEKSELDLDVGGSSTGALARGTPGRIHH